MLKRVTSIATSGALGLAAAVALLPASAHAAPAPATYMGHVQVVSDDGNIVGCVAPGPSYTLRGTDNAFVVTATPGSRQNLMIEGSPDLALGVDSSAYPQMSSGSPSAYTFLKEGSPTPVGSSSVGGRQTAIWTIDPATRELSADYVWEDLSSERVAPWYSISGWQGVTRSVSALHSRFPWEIYGARFRVGGNCSGSVADDVPFGRQAITFTSSAPSPAYPGKTYDITATGGASGKPVTLSSTTAEHCTIDGSTVTFGTPGTCTIEAGQAGSASYTAAPSVTQDITVSAIPSTVTVNLALPSVVTGQSTTATAVVDVAAGSLAAAGGTVQFTVDGTAVGSPVAIDADGHAVSEELGGRVGPRQVVATYVPADSTHYVGSSNAAALTVAAADTTTKASVTASEITATVQPVAPGAGTPTGEVTFHVDGTKVGTATLDGGTAKLRYAVPTDTTHAVSAEYAGDADFTASSTSTSRANPGITAKVSSSKKSRNGWYRTPVKVTFTCDAKGAELVTPCPKPVTVSKQGASSVSRTIRTADGGIATATAAVKVDRSKPRVSIKGVKARRGYFDAPKPTCKVTDSVSGVQTCKVTSKRRGTKVVVTAKATDVAGNVRTKRVTYRLAKFTIRGAKKVGNTYRVKQGKTYTLQVRGAKARYVYATPAPGKPNRGSVPFKKAGKNTWTLGVTMSMTTSGTRSWNLGYTQNGKLHVIKVKVTG
ncbi:Ig-like domain-containing protein [Aeromicrobium duanguangcaii]|uniref:Ig-like domain-containing protein n=1 Tax=Aeromicrobium duanguangcaii TaxID=2968086 RepID=A0ABY5KEW8_9ACTN|nr:Ig-like domain-containing protein [Aeromicrobium duanguangcaii]MCD9154565.1 Ig-like domain-containing protein [Aeromicrobium duanguangcaii]MCL3838317.1 Ig-like domain-containing protein [Aeromicrobium duanguangcaii]UUI68379.1 Ig-like domain-containing protein [Aeromicrobium duanguangcaii]